MAAFSSVEICSHREAVLFFSRHYFPYVSLNLVRLCVLGQPKTVGDTLEVGVHYDGRLVKDSSNDHICTLSPYTW